MKDWVNIRVMVVLRVTHAAVRVCKVRVRELAQSALRIRGEEVWMRLLKKWAVTRWMDGGGGVRLKGGSTRKEAETCKVIVQRSLSVK